MRLSESVHASVPLCSISQTLDGKNVGPLETAWPWTLQREGCHPETKRVTCLKFYAKNRSVDRDVSESPWYDFLRKNVFPEPGCILTKKNAPLKCIYSGKMMLNECNSLLLPFQPTCLRLEWTAPSAQNVWSVSKGPGTNSSPTETAEPVKRIQRGLGMNNFNASYRIRLNSSGMSSTVPESRWKWTLDLSPWGESLSPSYEHTFGSSPRTATAKLHGSGSQRSGACAEDIALYVLLYILNLTLVQLRSYSNAKSIRPDYNLTGRTWKSGSTSYQILEQNIKNKFPYSAFYHIKLRKKVVWGCETWVDVAVAHGVDSVLTLSVLLAEEILGQAVGGGEGIGVGGVTKVHHLIDGKQRLVSTLFTLTQTLRTHREQMKLVRGPH